MCSINAEAVLGSKIPLHRQATSNQSIVDLISIDIFRTTNGNYSLQILVGALCAETINILEVTVKVRLHYLHVTSPIQIRLPPRLTAPQRGIILLLLILHLLLRPPAIMTSHLRIVNPRIRRIQLRTLPIIIPIQPPITQLPNQTKSIQRLTLRVRQYGRTLPARHVLRPCFRCRSRNIQV